MYELQIKIGTSYKTVEAFDNLREAKGYGKHLRDTEQRTYRITSENKTVAYFSRNFTTASYKEQHYREQFVDNLKEIYLEKCEGKIKHSDTATKYKSIEEIDKCIDQNLTDGSGGYNKHWYVLEFKEELKYGMSTRIRIDVEGDYESVKTNILRNITE